MQIICAVNDLYRCWFQPNWKRSDLTASVHYVDGIYCNVSFLRSWFEPKSLPKTMRLDRQNTRALVHILHCKNIVQRHCIIINKLLFSYERGETKEPTLNCHRATICTYIWSIHATRIVTQYLHCNIFLVRLLELLPKCHNHEPIQIKSNMVFVKILHLLNWSNFCVHNFCFFFQDG